VNKTRKGTPRIRFYASTTIKREIEREKVMEKPMKWKC